MEPLEGNKHGKWLCYWGHMYIMLMLMAVQFSCILKAVRQDVMLDIIWVLAKTELTGTV